MIRLMLAAMLVLASASTPRTSIAQASQAPVVQYGIEVRPDTVTVGQHFELSVRVRAPVGATITFPPGPDSGASIEAIDPRTVSTFDDTAAVEQTARYVLAAWDTGAVHTTLGTVIVTAKGARREIPLDSTVVHVHSVLPADTSLRVPKPARSILAARAPWWPWLVAALVALALILLLLWWWLRRRRPIPAELDPYARAEQAFTRIDALRLIEAGERGRFVALNVEVLREYLAARVEAARRSLTSTELLGALQGERALPLERLAPVLAEADLIKFARRPVGTERARELSREVRGVVHDVEQALKPPEASAPPPEDQAA
ncbi:MAG TPA: hypothetical protein VFJ96_02695 [Gemmatimonadaceae bacterium]|nr:hypothetical protein [Gemmatimonadaceae bacterium]